MHIASPTGHVPTEGWQLFRNFKPPSVPGEEFVAAPVKAQVKLWIHMRQAAAPVPYSHTTMTLFL